MSGTTTKSVDSVVARLLARDEIEQLKARYCRFLDTRDWEGLAGVFTADAAFDFSDSAFRGYDRIGVVIGREAIAAALAGAVAGAEWTAHHAHMPEVEFDSDSSAHGIWAIGERIRLSTAEDGTTADFQGFGHHHETYRREGDRWSIEQVRLTRLNQEGIPTW